MSAGTVTVTECDASGTWLVALEGDHDLATAQQLDHQTKLIWPRCTSAVIDLSDAEFIDSGVIRWLLNAERQLEQFGAFTLSVVVGEPESVAARTIGLMGVRDRLACYASREQALAQAPRHEPARAAIARRAATPATGIAQQAAALQRPERAAAMRLPDGAVRQLTEGTAVSGEPAPTQLEEISTAMIRVYTEQFGRTPDRAHSHYTGDDAVACFLQGTLTRAERRLTTPDEHARLRDMRMLFQYSAETEFRAEIELITGRKVIAFISGIDTKQDIASEIFLLAPLEPAAARG